jgi:signal transduction histidine kinase
MPGIPGVGDVRPSTRDDNSGVDRARRAAVGLLGLGAVTETLVRDPGAGASVFGLIILLGLVGLATTLPLALPQPNAAATALVVAGVLSLTVLHTLTAAGVAAQLIVAYRLGRRGLPAIAAIAVVPYLLIALTAPGHTAVAVIGVLLASLLPAVALAATARRMSREDAERRAAQQAIAGTLLEHTARGERARIARELHDVVAHHISMVAVQAETARLTTPGMPAIGAQRLSAIGDTARAGLTEMRRLLGVLREDAQADIADRQPQPGLRQLADLLDETRDATGTGTRLILRGSPTTLGPGVELAAYRIVQEALTNTRRHAPGAAVDVELHYTDTFLRLLIRDNGPGAATPARAGGHGLLGMRERAAAVGGHLRSGPTNTGGFLVEATLPTRTEDTR